MKLHRLVLRNYRGISHRDIEFPDRGVVVVSGANEIGKSSMIEALDLLVDAKDRSTKKEVKQVKPTHVDEGAEITAEISTGAYRFEYHKRFHKKPETRLTVLAPVREQLTGDEAHDRVQAILAETVDTDLWRAQRVLQSAATAPVDLSGCDALARALDVAAGQAAALSGALTGSEPLLIDRIDVEYRQYFTAMGRATGPWAAAAARLRDADGAVASCRSQVDEVDEAVERHAALTAELTRLDAERACAAKRLAEATVAAGAIERLTDRLVRGRALHEGAAMAQTASEAALAERRRLRADVDERAVTIESLVAAVATATPEAEISAVAAAAAEAAVDAGRIAVETAQVRVDDARQAADRIARHDEAVRLAARLTRIDAVDRELVEVGGELAGITLTDAVMKDVELAALTTERAAAQAELASARVELDVVDGVRVLVDGESVELGAGATWFRNVTTSTDVEVPGVVTVRVVPGAPAADSQAKLDRARQMLDLLLAEAGVVDVEAARALDVRRRELLVLSDRLRATREALVGDDEVWALRERSAELADALDPGSKGCQKAAAAELEEALAEHRGARAGYEALRQAAATSATLAAETAGRVAVLRSKSATANAELAAAAERLARQRDCDSDDELAVRAQVGAEQACLRAADVTAIEAELAAALPAEVAAELREATTHDAAIRAAHDDVVGRLRDVTARLSVYGAEGRQGRLDAALAEREHALADHDRMSRRAGAAQLLQTVMARHRDQARLRYVDPFRAEIERLGRIVFGDDFEVEIDGDLRIRSRTLGGRTVPYESLSGGATEQLGIVARLASAALVAKEDGVPVIIDDALGFSDADRLARMAGVFDAVGGDGQVIVLTCSPERYAGIGDAQRIELTA